MERAQTTHKGSEIAPRISRRSGRDCSPDRRQKPEDFIECFSARHPGASANQELLVAGEWNGSRDLVRAQLAHVADLIGPAPCIAPKLELTVAGAQATATDTSRGSPSMLGRRALSTDAGVRHGKSAVYLVIDRADRVTDQPVVPTATKDFLPTHSPVHENTYFENVAGQVRPLVRERLPARL
jgi:hypothetical protein